MKRFLSLLSFLLTTTAYAGPGSASGPITVDSTTFVAGQSVMGTDGGVYSDTLPPVGSTTTAAFRMTKYRAEHVNLRNSSGVEIGTSGNPLYTTANSSITIGNVTILNSSFSVTGSTVSISGTVPVTVSNSPTVTVSNSSFKVFLATTNVTGSTVTLTNSGFAVTNTPAVTISGTPTVTANAGTGTFNTTGSTVTVNGSVSVGNQPIVNANQNGIWAMPIQVKNGAGTNTSVGWQSGGSSVPVYGIGTSSVNIVNQPMVSLAPGSLFPVSQSDPTKLLSSVFINGSSNAVSASQSGSWRVYLATTSVSISGSSNTVNAIQSGSWTNTVTQSTAAALQASVSINGSSNTVNAQQSGSWTSTVSQGTNSNLRASVAIDGSSNTVSAAQSGTWNINNTSVNVATVTISGTPSVNATLQSGSNTIGKINYATPAATVFSSTTINTSSTGDNTLVAGLSSQTVRVYRMFFVVSAATTITFKDGSLGLTGAMTFVSGGSFVIDFSGDPWFVTSPGNGFILNQSGTAQISGRVYFTQS